MKKKNYIWNRYICPAIEYTVKGIGILLIALAAYWCLVIALLL